MKDLFKALTAIGILASSFIIGYIIMEYLLSDTVKFSLFLKSLAVLVYTIMAAEYINKSEKN